jgi:hypothetical protein
MHYAIVMYVLLLYSMVADVPRLLVVPYVMVYVGACLWVVEWVVPQKKQLQAARAKVAAGTPKLQSCWTEVRMKVPAFEVQA